jgi:6-phosphogluconolactonase (cycloisomerase 2 family)
VPAVRRLVPSIAVFVFAFCALCGSAGAARFYVPSYGSGPPEVIYGFDLGTDGSLTNVTGSPFPGEEAGTGGLLGLAFSPEGADAASAFLFTGGIQGYSLAPGGALSLTNALPAAEGTGIAISPDGRYAFMSTRDPEGVARFAVGSDGSLTRLEPSSNTGTSYEVAVTPNGRFFYTVVENKIARFAIDSEGLFTPLGSTEVPSASFLGVSPDGRFLYVALEEGFRTLAIHSDGSLSPAGEPLLLGPGYSSPGYFGIAPDGSHVYFPDSNHDLIDAIAIASDGTPSLVGETAVENAEEAAVSPDGRFLVFYRAYSPYGIGVAAIGPGGLLTVLPSFVEYDSGEAEPLVFQPQPTPVARFSATAAPAGGSSRFDAGTSERAAHYEWNFGDGTALADGGPTPTHTYANPGAYQVTLVVTDAQGCSLRQVYTGQSTVCPGGSAARTVATVTVPGADKQPPNRKAPNQKPKLGKVRAVPGAFAPKVKGAKAGKVRLGTTFRFTVSEAATVRFKFERKLGKRFKKVGSLAKAAKAGASTLKWNGKLKGRPASPGRYRATVVATDKDGGRSAPKTVGFRILPVPPLR